MTRTLVAALAVLVAVPVSAQEVECTNGQAAIPDVGAFDCHNVDLVGFLARSAFALPGTPDEEHNDIWGWTDPQTGTEYALVGTQNGTGFVDLSDPTRPLLIGKLPSPNGRTSIWRDVKVYADHAFIVADRVARTTGCRCSTSAGSATSRTRRSCSLRMPTTRGSTKRTTS